MKPDSIGGSMSTILRDQILEQLDRLPDEQQKQVLEYVRTLDTSLSIGVAGKDMIRFAGFIPIEDIQQMEQAIEEDCEQINPNDW
jgi:hypothetical protein